MRDSRLLRVADGELRQRGAGALGVRAQQRSDSAQWQRGKIGDVEAGKGDRQRLAAQPLSAAERARGPQHELRHAALHQRALGGREGMQDVAPGTAEGALITRLLLALLRASYLRRRQSSKDRNYRLIVGEEDPVAIAFGQISPRPVDVVAERHQDIALILPSPGGRPGGDRPFADGQRVVGHHRALGHFGDPAETMAAGTRALRRIRRERLRVEQRLIGRIVARPRIQHPQQVRQRGALPTDERVLGVPRCCCRATAGGRPSIPSTSGTDI